MNKPTPTRHGAWRQLADGTLVDENEQAAPDASMTTLQPPAEGSAGGADDAATETTSTPAPGRKTKTRE